MSLIVWENSYSVNLPDIDEQHKKLIEIINQLYDAIKRGKGSEIINALLQDLLQYTEFHLNYEIQLMRKYEFEGVDEHEEIHNKLFKQVERLINQAKTDTFITSVDTLNFLMDWLMQHVCIHDKEFGEYINEKCRVKV